MEREIWVYVEQRKGKVIRPSLEVLSEGLRLAKKLGKATRALILGYQNKNKKELIDTLAYHGADKILIVDNECLSFYSTSVYAKVMTNLIKKYHPSILLFPGTSNGKDLAPRIAAKNKTGLISDCTYIKSSGEDVLIGTRSSYGQRVAFRVACKDTQIQMILIPPKVMTIEQPDASKKAEVIEEGVDICPYDMATRVIDAIKDVPKDMDLEDAEIIIAGGHGVGGPEGFKLLEDLADAFGGTIGASRRAVDAGWKEKQALIGQTGKIVSPAIYIACGISGASQHVIGMKDSQTIIAVNSDRNAPIFKIADIGVVGDLFEVVPSMVEKFRRLRKENKSL